MIFLDKHDKFDCSLMNFLTEKSGVSLKDPSIQLIINDVFESNTLKSLLQERYDQGNHFVGWTKSGSKGFTDVSTGDIQIKKTGKGTESLTLGYECMNSRNAHLYREIGLKYAWRQVTNENRSRFAEEVMSLEAEAMYAKCKIVTELKKRGEGLVNIKYLEIYDHSNDINTAIVAIKQKMLDTGFVYDGKKKAFDFYKEERFNEFMVYYKEQINSHPNSFLDVD